MTDKCIPLLACIYIVVYISFSKLQLKASLDQDFNACVGYDIDCKLFGFVVKSKGEACLSGKFLKSLVNGVTDSKDSPSDLKGKKKYLHRKSKRGKFKI